MSLDEDEIARFLRGAYPGLVAGLAPGPNGSLAAEDAVQEALVRAWQRAARGEGPRSLSAWVARVAANLLRDHRRRAQAEARAMARLVLWQPGLLEGVSPPGAAEGSSGWPSSGGAPWGSALAESIAALPRRQREVVLMYYAGDLSVREIAHRLGVGEGTVKRSLFRARRTLRGALAGGVAQETGRTGRPAGRPDETERRSGVKGWHMAGTKPKDYAHGIAGDETHEGKRVASVRCTAAAPEGFGTLMQMIGAGEYLGQRIRLSATLRAIEVAGWAGLWMRVDGPLRGEHLAFDNMQNRPITGTTAWRRHEVVLDVAAEARAIGLGVLLDGAGEVRVADFRFEPVSTDVPTTDMVPPARPQNLDLSED